jgi:hypothetical protein
MEFSGDKRALMSVVRSKMKMKKTMSHFFTQAHMPLGWGKIKM